MARKREEFLIELSKKVLRYNKSSEPFKVLYDRLIDNKIKLNKSYDYVESLARLKELKVVTDKIISIIFKPQIKSVTNEVILRSELAGAISTESFIKTMRDVKLWKNKEGELTPEYVYSLENIDSIDTFENRFISMLVDEIHNELKLILLNLSPLVETLEDLYQDYKLTASPIIVPLDMKTPDDEGCIVMGVHLNIVLGDKTARPL